MTALLSVLLASYIFYNKSLIKVDALKNTKSMAKTVLGAFIIVGFAHSSFVIGFAFREEIKPADNKSIGHLNEKNDIANGLIVVFQLIFYNGQAIGFYMIFKRVREALETMIKFHDYLIEYRLTPRSRILRKHLPKMSMVIEEESNMDQSSIGLDHSQSRLTNTSRMMSAVSHRTFTSTRRKFVYKDETAMTRNNTVTVPGSRPYASNSFSDIHASAEQLN